MKKRLAALLCAVLLLLCGCAPAQEPVATPAPTPMEGMDLSGSGVIRKKDVSTLLIGAVAYDSSGNSRLTSLSVLVRDEDGKISMLTLPKDARVWVEQYDKNGEYLYCSYGALGSVYHAAESAGLGAAKTVEAVSGMLGGVNIEHYVLLNTVQLQALADLAQSLMVMVEDSIPECGIQSGFQDIVPEIQDYASYSYLNSIGGVEYSGTDPYKLQRHQQLIEVLMRVFAVKMETMSPEEQLEYAQSICYSVTTDLTPELLLNWLGNGKPDFADVTVAEGQHDERLTDSYWIPENAALKEWVLEHCYLSEEE